MPEKWNLPFPPLPSWLSASAEVKTDPPKYPKDRFVVECMESLLRLGCNPMQAAGVTAAMINETAWGQIYKAWNLGGWKCTKAAAIAYAMAHDGRPIPFWRAPGNKAPGATPDDLKGGDPIVCYYRAFSSMEEFLGEWLKHFTPKPSDHSPYPAYKACGVLFWSKQDWFLAMLKAGYRGTNTQAHPEGAVAEHHSLVRAAITRWAQSKLGVKVDGIFGPVSRQACFRYQLDHQLPATGEPDAQTLDSLARL